MAAQGTPEPLPNLVYAQASPKSVGGASLFDAADSIDHNNVVNYTSEESVVADSVSRLEAAGFQVLQVAPTTINVAGPPGLYESYFETRLVTEERTVIKPQVGEDTATFIECPDTDVPGLIDVSRSPAADVLEGLAIEEPVYFHQSPFAPKRSYWHLDVPGDVSLGMNADRAHRMQVTGAGVRVVMVDSGWFRHPYFTGRGYRSAPVVLGPGALNPNDDESGHGTGESANLFAVAPDIDFTMVKINFVNSTAAFNTAVALGPQVISCSWGSDVPGRQLSAANNALAAAVANAVASGIIVVFSAGNGQHGFPGQHPDVISAGGVMMEPDTSLHATPYTSGFVSRAYPGRKVPDVSGLVGMPPRAAYIMLPLQAGDAIDRDLGNGQQHPAGDETPIDDGWAAFSGTSAAAPQIAGICALVRQVAPGLTPVQVKDVLARTARDVTAGRNGMGEQAVPGYDLATGHGLADAHGAVQAAQGGN
ncbi:S8 family serine peptidase [Lentzea sp. JNUCC 0626]|uniref:S8 family serine peptidase n=1 Tax=Lentzea sp. JNUCC 0626 TaxID=3367513 RepID=UPI0037498B45